MGFAQWMMSSCQEKYKRSTTKGFQNFSQKSKKQVLCLMTKNVLSLKQGYLFWAMQWKRQEYTHTQTNYGQFKRFLPLRTSLKFADFWVPSTKWQVCSQLSRNNKPHKRSLSKRKPMDKGPNATKGFVTDSTNADYKSNPRLFRSEFDDILIPT